MSKESRELSWEETGKLSVGICPICEANGSLTGPKCINCNALFTWPGTRNPFGRPKLLNPEDLSKGLSKGV